MPVVIIILLVMIKLAAVMIVSDINDNYINIVVFINFRVT
jgi:hypothetical protein